MDAQCDIRPCAALQLQIICHSDEERSSKEESAVPSTPEALLRLHHVQQGRVLYVGMTGFLVPRVLQHKSGEIDGFTRRYNITRLVYYEVFHYVNNAIARETEIKK